MSAPCSDAFRHLADQLGGIDCATAHPVVSFRAPWNLQNWTLSVVELLMITGAVLGLIHAVMMLRRHRQPAWLGLWIATVVYVLALEPFLYFPDTFGLNDRVGLVFAHNVFSIQFLYDRLPLYIVALYPAGIYLAHLLVDRLGVFRKRGVIVGAIATGVVHHAFYEIFDHLGPQLRWWAWNPDAPGTGPLFASVPLTSMVIFATIGPTIVVALARWLLFRDHPTRTAFGWSWRTVATGLLTPLLIPIISLPVSIVKPDAHLTLAIALYWAELLAFVAIGLWGIATSRPRGTDLTGFTRTYPAIHASLYLVTFIVLWLTALPDLLSAIGGTTIGGTPTGNPLYVLACLALCIWVVVSGLRPTAPDRIQNPARVPEIEAATS
jgi:hypothetical protein